MKRAIILSGVSGTGKTHARLNAPELKNLPHLDIADVYREFPEFDWYEAFWALAKQVREALEEHDTVVIEGYFLPGSTTRQWLLADLQVAGAKAKTRWFWAPFEVCQARIVAQFERGEITAPEYRRRIELLERCWKPQPSARW
jgi:adenylate kinase family enzyme